ncbi:MAG: glycogen debranching enzyme GlgX [Acidobacteria bacterium]|nr:glycogen debranching enzyme GlgX [Acidobacteriota bacterium]
MGVSVPSPLGATWDGLGVHFALFSEHATGVELCLFERTDEPAESGRVRLTRGEDFVWHLYVPGARPGQLYGYRVEGPNQPELGQRFDPARTLIDPYAKAFAKVEDLSDAPLGVVIDPAFDWADDRPPRTPWHETVIYEAHVKGLTARHPEIPRHLRGTYGAVAMPPIIEHFRQLGVTAVELMPIHQHWPERHLTARGQPNYWGYSTLGFFAPDIRYASSQAPGNVVHEFKAMVRALHAAGIEAILDVVYNHTAEGDHEGPTLSLKGIDNEVYYRLVPEDPSRYVDFTGCGNTVNAYHPSALQLVVDSLRYWVVEMHVDGFRFDLATTLAREHVDFSRSAAFFDAIHQDPVLSQVKLIAEPWDLGPGGYQVGHFPARWSEWNGRYRDTVRRFWRGDAGAVPELATRLAGSADLFNHAGRLPQASINFVTAHDGFTLHDLVSYNQKHNEANGEHNIDGENHNNSWNCGVEGPTTDSTTRVLREQQKRNIIATLFLSQGVPMLSGGDELGRTQLGNNNAYCQDNELSWTHWDLGPDERALFEFVCLASRIRREHPTLRQRSFLHGLPVPGSDEKDITWLAPDGREMTTVDWSDPNVKCVGAVFGGDRPVLYLMNAGAEGVTFLLPSGTPGLPDPRTPTIAWSCVLDTADQARHGRTWAPDTPYVLTNRSVAVFVGIARSLGGQAR